MDIDTSAVALIVAITTFIGVVANNFMTAWQARIDRRENRLHQKQAYLIKVMDVLIDQRAMIESYKNYPDRSHATQEWDKAYGVCLSIMLSIGDEKIRTLAREILETKNEAAKRPILDKGIERLGDLITNGMERS